MMAQDQQADMDRLFAMVDFGMVPPSEASATSEAVAPRGPVLNQTNPLVAAFLGCVDAWRDVIEASGLKQIGLSVKYLGVLAAFTDKFKSTFGQDELGQYAHLGDGRKLRPIDRQNHALFFRAVRYRFE